MAHGNEARTEEQEDGTEEITVEVDAEFITRFGDALRDNDESIEEFVSESCRERLRAEKTND